MKTSLHSSRNEPQRRKVDWKTLLAVAGLVFGVVQFIISQRSEREKQRLQLELTEEQSYNVTVQHLRFDHAALGRLIRKIEHGSEPSTGGTKEGLKVSLLVLKTDSTTDAKGRPGGWPGMIAVHSAADREPPAERDQEYRFLKVANIGDRMVDAVHIEFDTGEVATVNNMDKGAAIVIPIGVIGMDSNLTRTQSRIPLRAYYEFTSNGRKKQRTINVAFQGDWYTTDSPGIWQALPEFSR